tara:strand:+ start:4190 stop:4345 length:156 start_codon:yes stop_codon:yes gene_type:complete
MTNVKPEQLKLFKIIFKAYRAAKKNKKGLTFEEYLDSQEKAKAQLDYLGRK